MKKFTLILGLCWCFPFLGETQNNQPTVIVTNAYIQGITLHVNYDVTDVESDPMEVYLLISDDKGKRYVHTGVNATGDIGPGIQSGTNKSISLNLMGLNYALDSLYVKVVADDKVIPTIQSIVDQVSTQRLHDDLVYLNGVRHRFYNMPHLTNVRDSINNLFVNEGLAVDNFHFNYGTYMATDLSARKMGLKNESLVVINDAHYDTVSDAPGADDNGSGMVGVMEAARILSDYNFDKTIQFMGFDMEEAGLIGSIKYVTQGGLPSIEDILGVFNYEMIGYYSNQPNTQQVPTGFNILFPAVYSAIAQDSFKGNFLINVSNASSTGIMNILQNAANQYVPDLSVISLAAPGNSESVPDLRRSDHTPFWDSGHPALMLTDGANFRNQNYHTPGDSIGTINFEFMTNVVKATIGAICEIAGLQHSGSAIHQVDITNDVASLDCGLCVFPNPGRIKVVLEIKDCTGPFSIELMDNVGRIITKDVMDVHTSTYNFDLQGLEQGTYWVRVSKGPSSKTTKVVIQK